MALLTTLKDALDFKHIRGNNRWTIKVIEPVKNKKSTEKQKEAIELSSKLRDKYNVSLLLHSDLDFSDIRDYCSQSLISTIGFT